MKKDIKLIIATILLMLLMGCYKPLIREFIANGYIAALMQKLLQAITIIIYITKLKLWDSIGSIAKISKKSLLIILPVFIASFIPIFNGLNVTSLNTIFIILMTTLLIGVIEELVFRGIILSALIERGRITALLMSSVIFGLFHLLNLVYGADPIDTLVQVIFAFGFGLIMASVRYETDLLLPQILVHALWDFIFKISNTDFQPTLDTIHSISLVLIIVFGLFLTFKTYNNYNKN